MFFSYLLLCVVVGILYLDFLQKYFPSVSDSFRSLSGFFSLCSQGENFYYRDSYGSGSSFSINLDINWK